MKKKIVVVEDEQDIADLVKLVLETAEFEVVTVLDAQDALAQIKMVRPDAILLDLSMPKINGWEIFKQVRSDPAYAETPIAILTAKSEAFDEMVGLHVMKADAYITKPFGKQELIDKTYELFAKRKKQPDPGA
ncbi:MAG: response regulator [Chitinivibrionales bacterium]|nr:response regulator [Chitinivibrionales bacterium]